MKKTRKGIKSFYLDGDLVAALTLKAQAQERSVSWLLNKLIEKELQDDEAIKKQA